MAVEPGSTQKVDRDHAGFLADRFDSQPGTWSKKTLIRKTRDLALTRQIHAGSRDTYGHRRVHAEPRADGHLIDKAR